MCVMIRWLVCSLATVQLYWWWWSPGGNLSPDPIIIQWHTRSALPDLHSSFSCRHCLCCPIQLTHSYHFSLSLSALEIALKSERRGDWKVCKCRVSLHSTLFRSKPFLLMEAISRCTWHSRIVWPDPPNRVEFDQIPGAAEDVPNGIRNISP